MAALRALIFDSISALDRAAWDRLYGQACEGYDYFFACEQAPPACFRFSALGVFDGDQLIAGAPLFQVKMSLSSLVDGLPGRMLRWIGGIWPSGLSISILGMGSPHADELGWVHDPTLPETQRRKVLMLALETLREHARSLGAGMLLLKNLTPRQHEWMDAPLQQTGFGMLHSLPISQLQVPGSEEAYIQGLSANMRSNIRRKLKRASAIRVERREGVDDGDSLIQTLIELRDQTRARALTDYDVFEEVGPGYFHNVLTKMGKRAHLLLYWHENRLLGFAIALVEPGRLKEKYTGLSYPDALEHGIFFLNWMSMVRLCIENRIGLFHAGETTYLTKARLGCQFQRSYLYVRHVNPLLNALLRPIIPWFDLERADPDLKILGGQAPYLDR